MPKIQYKITERIDRFVRAWTELAPTASFAGMTLDQFKTATAPSNAEREQLSLLAVMQAAGIGRRKAADLASQVATDLVVNAIRGDPAFGSDSALYRALGFTTKSERRSGLTRKVMMTATAPTIVPMAA
jgi:hypothetical protein